MDEKPKIKILKKGTRKENIPTAPRPKPKDAYVQENDPEVKNQEKETQDLDNTQTKSPPPDGPPPVYQPKSKKKSPRIKVVVQMLIYLALILITAFICYMIWGNKNGSDDTNELAIGTVASDSRIAQPEMISLARENNYESKKDILRERMDLSTFFRDLRLPSSDAKYLSDQAYRGGLGRLNQGDKYTIYHDSLDERNVKYILIETKKDPQYYFTFDLTENMSFEKFEKAVIVEETQTAVIIEGNLAQTFNNNKLDAVLVDYLEAAYKWTFDFFELRDGDRFKMIYDREFINGKPGEIKKMKAMYFEVGNNEYYAFNYSEGRTDVYYNEYGQERKNAFLLSPIRYGGIITSGYGLRKHPKLNKFKIHLGTDYAAPEGTDILAVADGVVSIASHTTNNGNYVKIRHDATYETQYLHMKDLPPVRVGQRVKQGDVIGHVGQTGLATGPHVCFRFWKNKQQVNHLTENISSGKTISRSKRTEFDRFVEEHKAKLDKVEYF